MPQSLEDYRKNCDILWSSWWSEYDSVCWTFRGNHCVLVTSIFSGVTPSMSLGGITTIRKELEQPRSGHDILLRFHIYHIIWCLDVQPSYRLLNQDEPIIDNPLGLFWLWPLWCSPKSLPDWDITRITRITRHLLLPGGFSNNHKGQKQNAVCFPIQFCIFWAFPRAKWSSSSP